MQIVTSTNKNPYFQPYHLRHQEGLSFSNSEKAKLSEGKSGMYF